MTEKLDKLSNDIITLLKNHEPKRLRHNEICDSLFDAYKYNYKDEKSFGVAVTQKLKLLEAKKLIIHEDIWYGTLNSKSEEKQVETVKKTKQLSEDELRINFAKAFVDSLPEGKLKTYLQNTLIHDIETLYPKLSLEQILDSWELEQEALAKQDGFTTVFIRNLKERVRKG